MTSIVLRPPVAVRVTALLVASPLWIIAGTYTIRDYPLSPVDSASVIALAGLGAFFWAYLFSPRIVLTPSSLQRRLFGLRLWEVARDDAELTYGRSGDYGGFPALIVHSKSQQRRVGNISFMQFQRADVDALVGQLHQRDSAT